MSGIFCCNIDTSFYKSHFNKIFVLIRIYIKCCSCYCNIHYFSAYNELFLCILFNFKISFPRQFYLTVITSEILFVGQ